ncbi:MAG: ribonuclease P protein component [Endomicrobia bacterium]|nr:ribonuclease P protein component [Endomicrobiia bacterium]
MNEKKRKFTFKKYERISKYKEIKDVIEKGEKIFVDGLIVYLYRNPNYKFPRIAVLVSNKVEKLAVKRNKFKRRIREIFRLSKHKILQPIDIIIIATKNSVRAKYKFLETCFIKALRSKGLIIDDNEGNI